MEGAAPGPRPRGRLRSLRVPRRHRQPLPLLSCRPPDLRQDEHDVRSADITVDASRKAGTSGCASTSQRRRINPGRHPFLSLCTSLLPRRRLRVPLPRLHASGRHKPPLLQLCRELGAVIVSVNSGKSYSSPAGDEYKPSPAWFPNGESLGRDSSTWSQIYPVFVEFFFLVFLGFWLSFNFRRFF
jgi:hypothetical protein